MKKTVEGLLFPFAETGTEGWLWALQENYLKEYWSYHDLHTISDGDDLTIYDKDKKEIWSGTIRMIPNPDYSTENIHEIPVNFDKNEWIKMFAEANKSNDDYSKCYTGKLTKKSKVFL